MKFPKSARLGAISCCLVLAVACQTPEPVRDEARVASADVGLYRDQLQTNLKAANAAIASRRARAVEALAQDYDFNRSILLTQIIAVESKRPNRVVLEKMNKVAERLLSFEKNRSEATREFTKRVAAAAPSYSSSFAELQKAQTALTKLSAELDDDETLRFLLQFAKATAAAMREQAKALKAEGNSK